jgi:hypothetical protein
MITSHPLFRLMKKTIDTISTDDLEKLQVALGQGKLVKSEKMDDGYVEDLEIAGTTYLVRKAQGSPMATDTVTLGGSVRIMPYTMAKKVIITEEALEDNKYKEAINAPKRLLASAYRTQDADVASLIVNSTSSAAPGGFDALPLGYASHKLVTGSTTSNVLATYSTPSLAALILAKAQLGLMPGPNGLVQPIRATHIVCPLVQEDVWKTLIGSEKVTGSNWNDINIVQDYKLKVLPIYHLDASSTTQWGLKTDADDGFCVYEKRKITSKSWVGNDEEVMNYGVSYRLGQGWRNWRCWLQGNT